MTTVSAYCDYSLYSRQSALRRALIITVLVVIFSFLGWIAETVLFAVQYGGFTDRGLLTLPLCPIYGLGMLLGYAALRTPLSGVWRRYYSYRRGVKKLLIIILCLALYCALSAVIASVVEFITGLIYHKAFGVRLWSYEGYPDGVMGYISLRYSLIWGVGATACSALIWYPLQNALAKIKTSALAIIAAALASALIADFTINSIYLLVYGKRLLFL